MKNNAQEIGAMLTELDQISDSLQFIADAIREPEVNHVNSYYILCQLSLSLDRIVKEIAEGVKNEVD